MEKINFFIILKQVFFGWWFFFVFGQIKSTSMIQNKKCWSQSNYQVPAGFPLYQELSVEGWFSRQIA